MFCPHCGAPLNESARFCTGCGAKLENASSPGEEKQAERARFGIVGSGEMQDERAHFGIVGGTGEAAGDEPTGGTGKGGRGPKPSGKGRGPLWIAIGALALLALALLLGVPRLISRRNPSQAEIRAILDAVSQAAAPYEDENGDVPPEQAQAAIEAVYTAARNNPGVSSCRRDPYGVVIQIPSRPSYVYCPTAGGPEPSPAVTPAATPRPAYALPTFTGPTLGEIDLDLQIITLQPYASENREIDRRNGYSHDLDAPDLVAADLEARDPTYWHFPAKNNVDDAAVTMDLILSLNRYQVIIWQGHGAYSRYSGYSLCTNIPWSDELGRRYGLNDRNCCLMMDDTIALKPAFFAEHFGAGAFDNAYIYLGTCYSGKETDMARVFLDRGAAAVYVNSSVISRAYNLDMIHLVGDCFLGGESAGLVQACLPAAGSGFAGGKSAEGWSMSDALELGRLCYGFRDPWLKDDPSQVDLLCNVGELSYAQWLARFAGSTAPTPTPTPTAPPTPAPTAPPTPTPTPTPAPTPTPTPTPTAPPTPTPTAPPTPAPTPAPTPTPTPTPKPDGPEEIYYRFMKDNRIIYTELYDQNPYFEVSSYAFADLSGDGVPELLLGSRQDTYFSGELTGILICGLNNSRDVELLYYVDTDTVYTYPELCHGRWLVTRYHGTGGYCESQYLTFTLQGVTIAREINWGIGEGEPTYYVPSVQVDREVFEQYLLQVAEYPDPSLVEIKFTPLR